MRFRERTKRWKLTCLGICILVALSTFAVVNHTNYLLNRMHAHRTRLILQVIVIPRYKESRADWPRSMTDIVDFVKETNVNYSEIERWRSLGTKLVPISQSGEEFIARLTFTFRVSEPLFVHVQVKETADPRRPLPDR
jgi:hypothetical protein